MSEKSKQVTFDEIARAQSLVFRIEGCRRITDCVVPTCNCDLSSGDCWGFRCFRTFVKVIEDERGFIWVRSKNSPSVNSPLVYPCTPETFERIQQLSGPYGAVIYKAWLIQEEERRKYEQEVKTYNAQTNARLQKPSGEG